MTNSLFFVSNSIPYQKYDTFPCLRVFSGTTGLETYKGCIKISRNELITADNCNKFLSISSLSLFDRIEHCSACDTDGCNLASQVLVSFVLILVLATFVCLVWRVQKLLKCPYFQENTCTFTSFGKIIKNLKWDLFVINDYICAKRFNGWFENINKLPLSLFIKTLIQIIYNLNFP
jgi:hypothetical protein